MDRSFLALSLRKLRAIQYTYPFGRKWKFGNEVEASIRNVGDAVIDVSPGG